MSLKESVLRDLNMQITMQEEQITSGTAITDFAYYREAVGRLHGLVNARNIFVEAFKKYATQEEE